MNTFNTTGFNRDLVQTVDISRPFDGGGLKPDPTLPILKAVYRECPTHDMITAEINGVECNSGTHVDFPACLPDFTTPPSSFELSRFLGDQVAIVDVADKLALVGRYFDENGILAVDERNHSQVRAFMRDQETLEISLPELEAAVAACGSEIDDLDGLLLHTGLSRFWMNRAVDSYRDAYFFAPYLSQEACERLVRSNIKFVGIDAWELDHPVYNYQADETLLVLNPACQRRILEQRAQFLFFNHKMLLGAGILIYENLNIPAWLSGQIGHFSGVPITFHPDSDCTNGLCRPYVILSRRAA